MVDQIAEKMAPIMKEHKDHKYTRVEFWDNGCFHVIIRSDVGTDIIIFEQSGEMNHVYYNPEASETLKAALNNL